MKGPGAGAPRHLPGGCLLQLIMLREFLLVRKFAD
jgi:hypothetical protein